jgi:hypothetical protein
MPVLVQPATVPPAPEIDIIRVGNDHQRPLDLCVSTNHDHSRQMVSQQQPAQEPQRHCECQLPGMTASREEGRSGGSGQRQVQRQPVGPGATALPWRRSAADHATAPTLARPNAVLNRPTRRLRYGASGADPPHGGDLPWIDSSAPHGACLSRATRSCWVSMEVLRTFSTFSGGALRAAATRPSTTADPLIHESTSSGNRPSRCAPATAPPRRRPPTSSTTIPAPASSQSRPRRWAIAAASTRPVAPSLARMLETWTLAVLGLMNNAWAI